MTLHHLQKDILRYPQCSAFSNKSNSILSLLYLIVERIMSFWQENSYKDGPLMTTNEFSRLRTLHCILLCCIQHLAAFSATFFPCFVGTKCVKNACAQNWFLIFSVWSLIGAGNKICTCHVPCVRDGVQFSFDSSSRLLMACTMYM